MTKNKKTKNLARKAKKRLARVAQLLESSVIQPLNSESAEEGVMTMTKDTKVHEIKDSGAVFSNRDKVKLLSNRMQDSFSGLFLKHIHYSQILFISDIKNVLQPVD